MDELFSLKSKKLLLTGASSGIGKVIALTLANQGAEVIITGRNIERLNNTFNSLSGVGHQKKICDLTIDYERNNLVEQVSALNGVIFCAGAIDYVPAKQISRNTLDSIFNINFESQILLYQALHNQKKLLKSASLVFISSVSASSAVPATLAYSASKAAINASVRVLASELAKFKIRVNSVSPGLIKSPLIETSDIGEQTLLENEKKYPLGLPEEQDVANAVVFLLSDATMRITGTDLAVDGGYLLHK